MQQIKPSLQSTSPRVCSPANGIQLKMSAPILLLTYSLGSSFVLFKFYALLFSLSNIKKLPPRALFWIKGNPLNAKEKSKERKFNRHFFAMYFQTPFGVYSSYFQGPHPSHNGGRRNHMSFQRLGRRERGNQLVFNHGPG